FAGHDHSLQFLHVGETAHFISGAGSKTAPAFETADTPKDAVQFYYNEHGFLACAAYKDELRVAVVDMVGNVLDQVVIDSRTVRR
ncbi:MAG TPA: hypothetical protein VEF04_14570, partial [Blastocatellia bacterium]|nr:hypothetical protein [Blastocatellia bacterium]